MLELEEKIKTYFKDKEEVIAAYLFDSHAEGNEYNLSDVDIGIVFDKNNPDIFRERRNNYMVELGRILRKDIDAVILNSMSQELLGQVFRKGKCVIVNDSKKLARFRMVAFTKIAEFAYYRNRMQSGFISKILEA